MQKITERVNGALKNNTRLAGIDKALRNNSCLLSHY